MTTNNSNVNYTHSSLLEPASFLEEHDNVLDAIEEACLTVGAFLVVYAIGHWMRKKHIAPKAAASKAVGSKKAVAQPGPRVPAPSLPVDALPQQKKAPPKCARVAPTEHTPKGVTKGDESPFMLRSLSEVSAPSPLARTDSGFEGARSVSSVSTAASYRSVVRPQGAIVPRKSTSNMSQQFPDSPATSQEISNRFGGTQLRVASKERISTLVEDRDSLACKQFLASLRMRASKRSFQEGLATYDADAERIARVSKQCGSTWSLLLYCAVEAGQWERCSDFYARLCVATLPSTNDFVNMVRCCAQSRDLPRLTSVVQRLRERDWKPDAFARNRALGACCSCKALEMAEYILWEFGEVPVEIIAYNTLIKGYSSIGKVHTCLELYEKLMAGGLTPSDKTYGILLDACIGFKDLDRIRRIFADLKASGSEPNVVQYTAYLKCLVSAGLLEEAQAVMEEMEATPGVSPDLVTFSTLVKAFADRGFIQDAMKVLERMAKRGVAADSVVFNTVLSGCCFQPMATSQINRILMQLVDQGLKPSSATLSILVKAYATNKAWKSALEVLETSLERFGLEPELWIFAQLAQACVRGGGGDFALQAFVAMLKAAANRNEVVEKSLSSRMLRLCGSRGGGLASRLHRAVLAADGGCIGPSLQLMGVFE